MAVFTGIRGITTLGTSRSSYHRLIFVLTTVITYSALVACPFMICLLNRHISAALILLCMSISSLYPSGLGGNVIIGIHRDNNLLCNNLITYRAVFSFGQAGCRTGCLFCSINHLSVTGCCNSLLCNNSCATYRAVLSFGQAGGSTGCRYCYINHFGMSGCCHFLISGIIASRAVLVCFITCLSTSGCLSFNLCQSVILNCDLFGVSVTARASVGHHASFSTGGCLGFGSSVVVSGCCHFLISGIIASRAVLVCFITCLGTGGCLSFNLSQSVTISLDLFGVCITTILAGEGHLTLFGTGRSLGLSGCVVVSGCRYLVCGVGITTCTSVSGVTSLGTGGSGYNSLMLVSGRRNHFTAFGMTAAICTQ